MYYQNYEDYIRNILGYPIQLNNNTYKNNSTYCCPGYNYEYIQSSMPKYSSEILELYPEIYKILNPMICKICEANSKAITRELIEQMTDEIYLNIECDNSGEDTINVRVTVPNPSNKTVLENKVIDSPKETRTTNINSNSSHSRIQSNINQSIASQNQVRQTENKVEVSKNRYSRRNNTLRDLIKILILNQLLGISRPPQRPEMPRPPFPGGVPNNPRPPINPRNMYDLI